MKAVIQRVIRAEVRIENAENTDRTEHSDHEECRSIGRGLMILLGAAGGDNIKDADWLIRKIAAMRVFDDENRSMMHSLTDIAGEALVVSQFTLLANMRKGTRPSFDRAAPPQEARPLYDRFVKGLSETLPGAVRTGVFGALMTVNLINDGPFTLIIESPR